MRPRQPTASPSPAISKGRQAGQSAQTTVSLCSDSIWSLLSSIHFSLSALGALWSPVVKIVCKFPSRPHSRRCCSEYRARRTQGWSMANSRDIFSWRQTNVSQLLEQLNAAVRDGQHDAIFALEGHGRVGRTRVIQDVFTGAALALLVKIATLQNKNFFETNMPVRRITATRLHAK